MSEIEKFPDVLSSGVKLNDRILQRPLTSSLESQVKNNTDERSYLFWPYTRIVGVIVKRVDSYCRGREFESYTSHIKNTIGEEGNGKPSH